VRRARCFVAIELEQWMASLLCDVADTMRNAAPTWVGEKWVAQRNLHITLKFLGDLPDSVLPLLADELATATEALAAFELRAKGLVARPSAHRCSMVWMEFADPCARYAALADILEAVAIGYGVVRDQRAHRAHATLVRARRPKPIARHALEAGSLLLERAMPAMSVSHATLFTSTLTRTGPVYERVATAPLRATDDG
jgi:RNA 2',3'-cyclic 3'-phosphodiesterase